LGILTVPDSKQQRKRFMKNHAIKVCALSTMATMLLSGCHTPSQTPSAAQAGGASPAIAGTVSPPTYEEPAATAVQTGDQGTIELRKEEMVVGKRDVSNGGVVLRTTVQAENVSQPVCLRREEYVIERIPASEAAAWATNTANVFQGQEIYIPLTREEPVAGKRTLLTEKVQLRKKVETDAITVSHPIRSESV
jgi:uncharacterized protein (TIGR02271 family)